MRLATGLIAALFAVGLMGGCRADGKSERQTLMDQELTDCVARLSTKGGALLGLDRQLICACFVHEAFGTKDVLQLREMTQQSKASEAELKAMYTCVVDQAARNGIIID